MVVLQQANHLLHLPNAFVEFGFPGVLSTCLPTVHCWHSSLVTKLSAFETLIQFPLRENVFLYFYTSHLSITLHIQCITFISTFSSYGNIGTYPALMVIISVDSRGRGGAVSWGLVRTWEKGFWSFHIYFPVSSTFSPFRNVALIQITTLIMLHTP